MSYVRAALEILVSRAFSTTANFVWLVRLRLFSCTIDVEEKYSTSSIIVLASLDVSIAISVIINIRDIL